MPEPVQRGVTTFRQDRVAPMTRASARICSASVSFGLPLASAISRPARFRLGKACGCPNAVLRRDGEEAARSEQLEWVFTVVLLGMTDPSSGAHHLDVARHGMADVARAVFVA